MNKLPPNQDEPEDVDDHYRRVSALDPSRPSESVRAAVLAHAARLAAERAGKQDSARRAARQTWRRPAIFGTLAAAALAGILVAPHLLPSRAPPSTANSPASQPGAGATSVAREQIPARARKSAGEPPLPPMLEEVIEAKHRAAAPNEWQPIEAKRRASARNAEQPTEALRGTSAPNAGQLAAGDARSNENHPAAADSPARISAQNIPAASSAEAMTSRAARINSAVSAMPASPPASPALLAERSRDWAAALRRAAEIGDIPSLQTALDQQVDINARDASGRTALMLAVSHGEIAAVNALLAHGADPNATDALGTTPLQAAVAGDQGAIVAALKRNGAR
jgi:hypothetical protein